MTMQQKLELVKLESLPKPGMVKPDSISSKENYRRKKPLKRIKPDSEDELFKQNGHDTTNGSVIYSHYRSSVYSKRGKKITSGITATG